MAGQPDRLAGAALILAQMNPNPTTRVALGAALLRYRSQGRSLALVLGVAFLTYLAFGISRVGAAILIVSGKHAAIQLGIAMAAYSLAPLLMAVRAGAAATRFGPRRMLICGSSVLLGGATIQAVPGNYYLLFPGALLCGAGFTALQISLQLHIGEQCAPDARARHFGYFSLAQSLGTSAAALLAGYVSEAWSLRAPFWLTTCFAAALLALVFINRHAFRCAVAPPPARGAAARKETALARLVAQRDVRRVLLAGALLAMAWDLHTFIVPFVSRTVGLSPQRIGIVLGLFSGATLMIRILLPAIVRFLSSVAVIRAALVVVGLSFAVYPWHTSYLTMSLLAVALGLALGTAQPNLLALLHDVAQEQDVGRLVGLRTILLNVGSSLWPLCFGAVGQSVVALILPAVGCIFLLAAMRFSLSFFHSAPETNSNGPKLRDISESTGDNPRY
jgi:predicted MFS family arabinose efflux permease